MLPLWVAEMDVPLAEPVAQAVLEAVALGDTPLPGGAGTCRRTSLPRSGAAPDRPGSLSRGERTGLRQQW